MGWIPGRLFRLALGYGSRLTDLARFDGDLRSEDRYSEQLARQQKNRDSG
jgi:hypothetical protein